MVVRRSKEEVNNFDTARYSLIDSGWPKVKNGIEKWLSDENFDEHGQQKKRLSYFIE